MVKIASPELNHFELLQEVSKWNVTTILSTGVSTLSDIERALVFFPRENIYLLHCITSYPAPESEYNLTLVKNLANIFGVKCGVSDHSLDPVLVPCLSIACGALMIEKHFCLSHDGGGLDDKIALVPKDFEIMCNNIHKYAKMKPGDIVSELSEIYGAQKISAILGDGVKRLSKSEEANYGRTNRSIHALNDIRSGELITKDKVAVLRTEKVLRPGLAPEYINFVAGRIALRDIYAGEGIVLGDI
jgi:sialic acid synthase SpsE